MVKIENYNYKLSPKLIAKIPASPRDTSRLLVFNSKTKEVLSNVFLDIRIFLRPGDLLIANNSKVIPARIFGQKKTGGKIELLLIEKNNSNWQVLIGGKINVGDNIYFSDGLEAEIIEKDGKESTVKFNFLDNKLWRVIDKIGQMPIPPYIKNSALSEKELRHEYQTVYAKKYGSAAAPTAGLHFSEKLIGELKLTGIQFASIDLHVGLGTFSPIGDADIKNKKLHFENFDVPHSTVEKILRTKENGGRIIAIGTTTVRALESAASNILSEKSFSGSTDIFIQPGDKFQIVDGLITNFHLPKSSLMMLVAAFIQDKGIDDGREQLLELYRLAIKDKYRFYSFGDAMLII